MAQGYSLYLKGQKPLCRLQLADDTDRHSGLPWVALFSSPKGTVAQLSPWIEKKMGQTRRDVAGDPCQKEACNIQTCLQANNYQEDKCAEVIEALRRCCAKFAPGQSVVCSGMYGKKPNTKSKKTGS